MTTLSRPTPAELAAAPWRTSTYSAANNECVEVAPVLGGAWVGVRDTKVKGGPVVAVPASAFAAVVSALRDGTI
ncbi:DUF397 domain-containing protein [Streptomyces lavendulocolor]